jgi:hypothetical protein
MRVLAVLILVAVGCGAHAAETVVVAPDVSVIMAPGSGEAQSTVVAPGHKNECPNGRFIASNDAWRPSMPLDLVQGRNLNDLNGTVIQATFDLLPHPENYSFVTNDHDLVSLANGDILYITGAASRAPLADKPAWFDVTYRGNFGPGTRSVVLVWRSTDCGQTFHFASEFDPARVLDGSCAFPQFPRKTTAPGSDSKPVYDMGGSDGQLAKVDLGSGRIYLTFSCVGYLPDKIQTKTFELTRTPIDKTLVVASLDGGGSWTAIGAIRKRLWRSGLVPLSSNRIAFGVNTGFVLGQPTPFGDLAIDATALPVAGASWGWAQDSFYKNNAIPNDLIHANLWASTIVARAGASAKILLAFPSTVVNPARTATHGYRLFIFDPDKRTYRELDPIVPAVRSPNNFLMHLAAIELRQGPVLLYWSEFLGVEKKGSVRGRIIFDDVRLSSDFPVSRRQGAAHAWDMPAGKRKWYGDYQTASGFIATITRPTGAPLTRYHYYPMWVEPADAISFTEVTVDNDPSAPPRIRLNQDDGPEVTVKTALDRPAKPAARTTLSRMPTGPQEEADSDREEERERDERLRDRR